MSDLVGNPEDRFSRVAAQIIPLMYILDFALRILFKEPLRCHMDGCIYKSVE